MKEVFTLEESLVEQFTPDPDPLERSSPEIAPLQDIATLDPIAKVGVLCVVNRAFYRMNKNQIGETPFFIGEAD